MSLVNEYKHSIRERMGLKTEEIDPVGTNNDADVDNMDETTLKSLLSLVQREIDKREATGETESGVASPATTNMSSDKLDNMGEIPSSEVGGDVNVADPEAEQVADDIYFEMLNTFKTNISSCGDDIKKEMYRRCYNYLYKMRDKFLAEMIKCDEPKETKEAK
jgi:hypothetical protein